MVLAWAHDAMRVRMVTIVGFALAASGCRDPHLAAQPLPPLVAVTGSASPLPVRALALPDGTTLVWQVSARGMSIGRVELAIGDREVRSRFRTSTLASAFTSIDHQLATSIDRAAARAVTASERLVVDGKPRSFEGVLPPGVHTLHSALGALLTWAAPGARSGYLDVSVLGERYRIELASPVIEDPTGTRALRIDCRVLPPSGGPLSLVVWVMGGAAQRIQISADGERITADLLR